MTSSGQISCIRSLEVTRIPDALPTDARVLHIGLDLSEISPQKFEFDPVGHYARPDVFPLEVDERPRSAFDFLARDDE
jgi:hypothetical protein